MISPHFPPDSSAGTHRVRLLAPHLASYGWTPTVLTVAEQDYEGRIDPELGGISLPFGGDGLADPLVHEFPRGRQLHHASRTVGPDVHGGVLRPNRNFPNLEFGFGSRPARGQRTLT